MRLMKKLLTILFAFMMVLATTTMVYADEGVSTIENGKITIDNAIDGKTYTIYRIFELESFSDDGTNGRYAYKTDSEWNTFLNKTEIKDVYITFDGEYIKWKSGANVDEFAAKALAYARENTAALTEKKTATASSTTVTFDGLKLGYYLVDSGVGALCSLDTTNLTANIKEKNSVPTVDKKVRKGRGAPEDITNANIGQVLQFETTVTVGDGPQNYVLHDVMDESLTYDPTSLEISYQTVAGGSFDSLANTNYSTTTSDGHTFDVKFNQTFLNTLNKDSKIVVYYKATLNEKAKIVDPNNNKTWLVYGDNNTSNYDTATIRTFRIPAFKFYKPNATATETPLAGAKFKLSTKPNADLNDNTDFIKFVYDTNDATNPDKNAYRKALDSEIATTIEVATNDKGYATFQGLEAGNYYLYETEATKGFNKLSVPIQVEINIYGILRSASLNQPLENVHPNNPVKIENKTGTVLPSTGGMGTTMMYIVGVALLIGSGVLLITKKSMK